MPHTPPLSEGLLSVFAIALLGYLAAMYVIGFLAQRKIRNVEDFVLAGRRLPVSLATITIIATWFGAESLMTTADEVSNEGLRKSMLDPVGISVCLLLAGLFVAGPLWRMNLLTIPDFFYRRFGKVAEVVASLILVPSYFGWVAAQFVALAQLLETFFGIPKDQGILAVAVLGTGYTLLGGMWTITWTDAVQIGFILLGLLILGHAILIELGGGWSAGIDQLWSGTREERWRIADPDTFWRDTLTALSALAVGALGNLPMQDLMQRICSAGSDKIAAKSCLLASGGYLLMGVLPVGTGMAAYLLLPEATGEFEDVVMVVASRLLSPALLLVFFLAIVSAVLSTIVSAVLAPSAVLAHNLIEPAWRSRLGRKPAERSLLLLQRGSIVAVAAASALLAYGGEGAYELVQASYSMALVGMFVPFIVGLRTRRAPALAAIVSMVFGIGLWGLHMAAGWELFLEPWTGDRFPLPQELAATAASAVGFAFGWVLIGSHRAEQMEMVEAVVRPEEQLLEEAAG